MARYAKSIVRADGKELTQITAPNDKVLWQKPTLITESGNGLVEMDDAVGNYDGAVNSAKFYGKTLKMCQLVQNGDFSDGLTGWSPRTSETLSIDTDGSLTYTTRAAYSGAKSNVFTTKVIIGHKYFISCLLKTSIVTTLRYGMQDNFLNDVVGSSALLFYPNTYTKCSYIGTYNGETYAGDIHFGVATSEAVSQKINIKDVNICDITKMEQESLTAATFKTLYGKNYYPHGEYLVSNDSKWECRGHNLWDEQWEVGSISITTGADITDTTCIREKGYTKVLQNTSMCIKKGNHAGFIYFYGENKEYISSVYFGGGETYTFNTNDAHYIRFRLASSYGTTYNNDICINISDPSFNGQYEPYHNGGTVDLSEIVLRSSLDGTVKDEFESQSGLLTRRVDSSGTPLATPTTETVAPQPITLQKGYNALRQVDGSLANTEAEVKYYGVGGELSLIGKTFTIK